MATRKQIILRKQRYQIEFFSPLWVCSLWNRCIWELMDIWGFKKVGWQLNWPQFGCKWHWNFLFRIKSSLWEFRDVLFSSLCPVWVHQWRVTVLHAGDVIIRIKYNHSFSLIHFLLNKWVGVQVQQSFLKLWSLQVMKWENGRWWCHSDLIKVV